jgi:hypothetical protein
VISRPEAINQFLACFKRPHYLEIGVSKGETFFEIKAERKVAVDPKFMFSVDDAAKLHQRSEFHEVTSDYYFGSIIRPDESFQVIYLDGLHTFEQTLRDFTNAIHFLARNGVIVIDDVVPNSYKAALADQSDSFAVKAFTNDPDNSWMGDTYKLVFFIEAFFPTFELRTIADNHGQAVVWRAARPRKRFAQYTAHDIARLEFLDVVKNPDVFRKQACAEIVQEFKQSHRA